VPKVKGCAFGAAITLGILGTYTWWRRKKSHLLRCSDFSDSQHTICMPSILKNHYALYMKLFT